MKVAIFEFQQQRGGTRGSIPEFRGTTLRSRDYPRTHHNLFDLDRSGPTIIRDGYNLIGRRRLDYKSELPRAGIILALRRFEVNDKAVGDTFRCECCPSKSSLLISRADAVVLV